MNNRSTPPRPLTAYWWCQAGGWGVFFLFTVLTSKGYAVFSWNTVGGYLLLCCSGVIVTDLLRGIILRRRWIELPIAKLLPRLIGTNLLLALLLVAIVWSYFIILPPPTHISWLRDPEATVAIGAASFSTTSSSSRFGRASISASHFLKANAGWRSSATRPRPRSPKPSCAA